MTPSELKYNVLEHNPESHFFDRETMKCFGDTMRNYGVSGTCIQIRDGQAVEVWELYRKRAVKSGLQRSAFFDKETFCRVFAKKDWE